MSAAITAVGAALVLVTGAALAVWTLMKEQIEMSGRGEDFYDDEDEDDDDDLAVHMNEDGSYSLSSPDWRMHYLLLVAWVSLAPADRENVGKPWQNEAEQADAVMRTQLSTHGIDEVLAIDEVASFTALTVFEAAMAIAIKAAQQADAMEMESKPLVQSRMVAAFQRLCWYAHAHARPNDPRQPEPFGRHITVEELPSMDAE